MEAQCFTIVVIGMQSGSAKCFYSLRSSSSPVKAMASQETALPKLDSQSSSSGMFCFLGLGSFWCMHLFRSFWFSLMCLEEKVLWGVKQQACLSWNGSGLLGAQLSNLYSYWQFVSVFVFLFLKKRRDTLCLCCSIFNPIYVYIYMSSGYILRV